MPVHARMCGKDIGSVPLLENKALLIILTYLYFRAFRVCACVCSLKQFVGDPEVSHHMAL